MMRFLVPIGVFIALVLVLAIGLKRAPEKEVLVSPLIGKPAPEFSLPDLMNPERKVGTEQLRGRWYLLNVWGTWCVECRHEHDMLLDLQRQGVLPLIGLNWKDEDPSALAWLAQLGNPYEFIPVDHDGETAINWGVYGAPETFLVNDQGIIVQKYVGPLTPQVWERVFVPHLPKTGASGS